jgi:hypothetical protein
MMMAKDLRRPPWRRRWFAWTNHGSLVGPCWTRAGCGLALVHRLTVNETVPCCPECWVRPGDAHGKGCPRGIASLS